ncbi:exocyst complex component 4-like isoform X4 [Pomacea canaliculata]|uniref:exocyst complex component 4-like isoform X4 n=1 Tax=Pomacea canaliculata TaxID=400727 RepID=UPI000D729B01|nr:exocyst complex component 4-like isoform X4 [Pomacea canaliculata]
MASDESKTPISSKGSSAYLMSIVRTLSSSADFEHREQEKTRIEKAFRESDKRLGELVANDYQNVTKILQSFSKMTKSINDSREKIRKIKEDLSSCKTLLHFKRDELRKLWRDGVEHKAVLSMLEQIEQIKEVPDKMDNFIAKKHYLHATDLIVQAVAKLEGPLAGVDALRDLKVELISRKETLHEKLIEELNKQIYVRAVQTQSMQRSGSARLSRKDASVWGLTDGTSNNAVPSRGAPTDPNKSGVHSEVTEDLNQDPTENLTHFINILMESLFVLRKLPEAVEITKMRIEPELLSLVSKATQQIAESAGQQSDSLAGQSEPRHLLDLLQLIFQQFRCIAATHQLILNDVRRLTTSSMPLHADVVYDMKDVWSNIQAVLQVLLSEYLDVRNSLSSRQQAPSDFDEPTMDISMYFGKKRPGKPKKVTLFRFDASLHALSTNSYIEDTRQFDASDVGQQSLLTLISKQQKICKPSAFNITAIYKPLKAFIHDIEDAMESTAGLQEFITDFVQNAFLGQVHQRVSQSIDVATRVVPTSVDEEEGHKCFDALRNVIDEKVRREMGVPRPLLQSTVTVDESIGELQELMLALPDYADQFLTMVCNVLREYRDKCHSAYRDIVQHGSDDRRVISAMWAKDEDISRFLRSLPSWHTLQPSADGKELDGTVCSEQEMRALNSKEAIILITNLSTDETLIPQQEIITDVTQMRTVANVHESLEWFASRLQQMADSLAEQSRPALAPDLPASELPLQVIGDAVSVSPKTLESLRSLVKDFRDLAEVCLLLLHLEVRVHCFYYLLPVAKQSNYAGPIDDLDPDSNVLKLNKDLSSMEEVLSQSLQPKKFKYIFETLGYLVASIIISSVQFLKKINENGIKKMCRNILAIQQNLTNITMTREADLDRARQFYELLYLSPDDVLTSIAEKGPQFTGSEYDHLISLYHRSHPGHPIPVQEARMKRLREIMEKGQSETV